MGSFRLAAGRRKDPMNLYCSFALDCEPVCVGLGGGNNIETKNPMEPSLKYHPDLFAVLTEARSPGRGPCMAGSLTGAVSSQRVTEECEGTLDTVGNRIDSAMAYACLTARRTCRAGAKAGHSDLVVLNGRAITQRIKGTLGITGSYRPRAHIDGGVWHLDVGSAHPGAVAGRKGMAVRHLKRYVSWV